MELDLNPRREVLPGLEERLQNELDKFDIFVIEMLHEFDIAYGRYLAEQKTEDILNKPMDGNKEIYYPSGQIQFQILSNRLNKPNLFKFVWYYENGNHRAEGILNRYEHESISQEQRYYSPIVQQYCDQLRTFQAEIGNGREIKQLFPCKRFLTAGWHFYNQDGTKQYYARFEKEGFTLEFDDEKGDKYDINSRHGRLYIPWSIESIRNRRYISGSLCEGVRRGKVNVYSFNQDGRDKLLTSFEYSRGALVGKISEDQYKELEFINRIFNCE